MESIITVIFEEKAQSGEKLISIQKSAFPLYWVLIVDFSDWMTASPWIMMPYNPPHGESRQEIERERHREKPLKK